MQDSKFRKYGTEISKIVPRLVNDPSKIHVLDRKSEMLALEENKPMIESEFGCAVEIIAADASSEPKAKQAMPGKPAIVVK